MTVRRLEMEVQAVLRRRNLIASGLVEGNLHDALDVLDEGIDLKRYTFALDEAPRKKEHRVTTCFWFAGTSPPLISGKQEQESMTIEHFRDLSLCEPILRALSEDIPASRVHSPGMRGMRGDQGLAVTTVAADLIKVAILLLLVTILTGRQPKRHPLTASFLIVLALWFVLVACLSNRHELSARADGVIFYFSEPSLMKAVDSNTIGHYEKIAVQFQAKPESACDLISSVEPPPARPGDRGGPVSEWGLPPLALLR